MSTTSLDQTTATDETASGAGDQPPLKTKPSGTSGSLYRVIWRWHFYAGMMIAPVLIVVAATGALSIFKDELEAVVYPGVTYVKPAAQRTSYEQQIAAIRAADPGTSRIILLQVFTNPKRATGLVMIGGKFQYYYADPYRGHYLGGIARGGFFDAVLDLHRNLFLGTTGRIIVELTTCWGIVLAVTGIYLWWPKKSNQVWGVWLPRLRKKPYVILRDLHVVPSIYVAVVAILIAMTGLLYTFVWGRGFQYAGQVTQAYDMFSKSMVCKSPPEAKDLPVDRIIEIAQQRMPGNNLTVWYPRIPNGVFLVSANNDQGPQVNRFLFIDRASGEILEDRPLTRNQGGLPDRGVELYAARRLCLGDADQDLVVRDLPHPDGTSRDGGLDVVGASSDGPAGAAPPCGNSPPGLAARHDRRDQSFPAGAGNFGDRVDRGRASGDAITQGVAPVGTPP